MHEKCHVCKCGGVFRCRVGDRVCVYSGWLVIVCARCLTVLVMFFGHRQDVSTHQPRLRLFPRSIALLQCLLPITRDFSSYVACCLGTTHRGLILRLGTRILNTTPHDTVKAKCCTVPYRFTRKPNTVYRTNIEILKNPTIFGRFKYHYRGDPCFFLILHYLSVLDTLADRLDHLLRQRPRIRIGHVHQVPHRQAAHLFVGLSCIDLPPGKETYAKSLWPQRVITTVMDPISGRIF